jgi:hypothetical protein
MKQGASRAKPDAVTFQKTERFTTTDVKTSNPTGYVKVRDTI